VERDIQRSPIPKKSLLAKKTSDNKPDVKNNRTFMSMVMRDIFAER